jgi:hypothetical protein
LEGDTSLLIDTVGFWVSQHMLSLTASLFFYVCLLPYGFDAC